MSANTHTIRMVDTLTQYQHIKQEVDQAIRSVVESGAYIGGPAVNTFRQNLAKYLGAQHVIPCANGTDALQVALMALNLEPGDEVLTPAFTYFATAEVVALLQLKPVFVDVDPNTFLMDVSQLEGRITSRTRVILPVHLFGMCCDMAQIMQISRKHNLFVVEDNAQAIGATCTLENGTAPKAGTIGHIGCTSFYPSKNLGAYGDGGAIFTQDDRLAENIHMICNHGCKVRYYHDIIGVNSRLDTIQAAILDIKLRHLDTYNANRQQAAAWYDELLGSVPGLQIPARAAHSTHVFHQYTLRILDGREKRDRVKSWMDNAGIPTMIYYPVPLHLQKAYAQYGFHEGDYPVSEMLSAQVISLPIHSELDREQVTYISQNFIKALQEA